MIDKSLRQHYDVPETKKIKGQLHKLSYITNKEAKLLQKSGGQKVMTPEGVPAYPPPGERGGPGSGSEGRSPGGEGRGEYRSPSPKPKPKVEIKNPFEETGQMKIEQEKIAKNVQELRDKAKELKKKYPNQADEFDDPEFYVGLDKYMEGKGLYSSIDKPTIDTGDAREKYISQQYKKPYNPYGDADLEGQKEIDDIRAKRELQFNPNLSKDRQKALEVGLGLRDPKQGFWDSGLGTLAKGVGAAVAWPVASAFAPKELVTAAKWAKRAKDIKEGKGLMGKIATKFGVNEKFSNLTSTIDKAKAAKFRDDSLLGTSDWQGEKKKRTFHEPKDRDGVQPTLAETVTQGAGLKEGQKMLGMDDKQIQQIYQGRDLLKQTIESGMYQDRKLNINEMKMLQGHMMKMENLIQNIESYQVRSGSAHGGFIDQPFTGRSRDI